MSGHGVLLKVWTVPESAAGTRLDRFLAANGLAGSRERVQRLIESGAVSVGKKTVSKPSFKVEAGQDIRVTESLPLRKNAIGLEAVPAPLEIAYEDESIIVINKPRGVVVHPGAGTRSPTLVQQVIAHTGLSPVGAPLRPGVVHRIDKDTSGLIVFAKNERTHLSLAAMFAKHDIDRIYDGIVWGRIETAGGRIESRLGRHPQSRTRFASVRRGGKAAVTHWKKVVQAGPVAHLRFKLETGRTHQIRVHSSEMGHPLVGDPVYGPKKMPCDTLEPLKNAILSLRGQALHAGVLGFVHPETGQKLRLEAPMPADMKEVLSCAGS